MKDVVLNEILKKLNWKERIVIKLFTNTFYKIYKIGITYGFNSK